mgnify:CR=1 FL=1
MKNHQKIVLEYVKSQLLKMKEKPLSQKRFEGRLKTTRKFPKVAAYIVLGSLCLTYALFILTATSQM